MEGRRKDGSEFPVEFSLAALEEGGAWHAVGVVRDIAERKQAEQEIRRNEERFRAIFEQSPLGIALIDSVTGQIYEVNTRFAAIAGRTREVMATIDWMSITHPDDVQEDLDNMARLNAGEIPGFRMNKRYLKPDGAAVWISMTVAPTQVEDAARPCHLCMIEDITELKEAEEALRRNVSLYATIHRHVVDLIAIIDGHGRRLYTSPSYLFVLGYSQEEMQALSSLSLLHPEDHDRVAEALHGVMEGRPTQGLGYRLRHRDGRWLDFESKAAIIPDDGTGTARALVVARDVTERKASERNQAAMEVQLRQAQKLEAIGQLAAGIAHEINTPTQFIGDNTSFLRDAFQDAFGLVGKLAEHLTAIAAGSGREADLARTAMKELETADLRYFQDEIPKAIQQSLEGVGRISKIVKAMKDFSHPGGETKTLTDLHQAIESTITVSRNEWKYAANLVTEFDPDLPLVPCFPGEFNQVILNLIVNAAHAIEAAHGGQDSGHLGQIRVGTRLGRDEVLVFVTDDGTGIPAAVQARMFDPFYTTKAVGKGSGQGLAIAHAVIVEKHQGRITVESVLGQGTTFTLHLPLETPGQEGGAE